ncbi:MAG: UDP-glucose 4-epimerase GalE [Candidatus Tritonobacter lacicola]|nr:UDP-glucose 4-epimerase GalE [Candidatus Tritonobacter lacicola]
MKLLVTGGAGYIGSVTVEALLSEGHEVTVYDNLENGYREAVVQDAGIVVGDLSDADLLRKSLGGMDAVIHFAAHSKVPESVTMPAKYFRNNLVNSIVLLNAMREEEVPKIVFSSTAAVYGVPSACPIMEDSPTEPINPYGESKLFFEGILEDYHRAYGIGFVSVRYFNAAGATDRLGEDHRPETHLIPIILKAALSGSAEVKIYGTDYNTPDGTCVRDYIHVSDLAAAHILALEPGCQGIFNLGNGTGYSVRQVIDAAREITGMDIKTVESSRRPGDPPILVASSERISRALGWKPRYPELGTIIETAWNWMRAHPEGYGK